MTEHVAVAATRAVGPTRQSTIVRRLKRGASGVLWALAGVLLVVIMWELVKWLGGVISLPMNTTDSAMPHAVSYTHLTLPTSDLV